ncbi:MAG: DUF1345 domain-containing protein [Devosia sp.]
MVQGGTRRAARHVWFYVAAALGVVAGAAAAFVHPGLTLVVGANVFFLAYVAQALLQIGRLTPAFLKTHASDEDAPALLILLVTVAAVAVSAISLFVALAGGQMQILPVVLGALSVVLGWFTVHTMWAMHYAFEYYQVPETNPGKGKVRAIAGGLDFPGGDEPDGHAFLYFSYVIGMTAQTSDTEVTSNVMRRIVTVHSVFSFFFNTVIVAAAVNLVVSLGR